MVGLFFKTLLLALIQKTLGEEIKVTTKYGEIIGSLDMETGNMVFLGVPYASPPVGALRFKPPQPPQSWAPNTFSALERKPSCYSVKAVNGFSLNEIKNQAEDCLYLNIWVPRVSITESLAVMVWIHGGGFIGGSSIEPYYNGNDLSKNGNVIVVTINYRLGLFGFLASELLAEEDPAWPTAGNFGLLDQSMALQWVRDNIKNFGGDPEKVTIFGESAGSFSICFQMLMPKSRGLFKRAILQSGSCAHPLVENSEKRANKRLHALDKTTNFKLSAEFLSKVGCADTHCLRNLSAKMILDYQNEQKYEVWPFVNGIWPYVDGLVVPDDPVALFKAGNYSKVDVILGTNLADGTIFSLQMTYGDFANDIRRSFPQNYHKILPLYPQSHYKTGWAAWSQVFTDFFFLCPGRSLLKYLSSNGGSVYQYYYTHSPSYLQEESKILGAFHGAEIFHLFNETRGSFLNPKNLSFNSEEAKLSKYLIEFWTTFAEFGVPSSTSGVSWSRFTSDEQNYIDFNTIELKIGRNLRQEQCDVYDLTVSSLGTNIRAFTLMLSFVFLLSFYF